jgi:hypothetical protein
MGLLKRAAGTKRPARREQPVPGATPGMAQVTANPDA